MDAKREQALVGLFVLLATALLVATVFSLSGAFGQPGASYRAYFRFAGGLEPGGVVRFGGVKAGRIERLQVDAKDPSRIEITFNVQPDTPVKTDSIAKITSLGALGDNYLEITTGTAEAKRVAPGSVLSSTEYVNFTDLTASLNDLKPKADELLTNLNRRIVELERTIARVNDLLNDPNRANVSSSLSNIRGILEENRPKLRGTMTNVEHVSEKVGPLVDDFRRTSARAEEALAKIDAILGENREDVRKAVQELRQALGSANDVIGQLHNTLNANTENIDEILENMRVTTENLKQFTDTIKTRPYTLIRSASPPDRKPGAPPK